MKKILLLVIVVLSILCNVQSVYADKKIEVSDYIGKWNEIENELISRGLNFSNSGDVFFLGNDSYKDLVIYDIQIGDDKSTVDKKIKHVCSNTISIDTETELSETKEMSKRVIIDSGNENIYYEVKLLFDTKKVLKSWSISNWDEGIDTVYIRDILSLQKKYKKLVYNSWQNAYVSYILSEGLLFDDYQYELININGDSVPELFIKGISVANGNRIITYAGKNKVNCEYLGDSSVSYIECENILKNVSGRMDSYYDTIYTIKNRKFEVLNKGDYGAIDNSNIQLDENGEPVYYYYWNDKSVSIDEYKDCLANAFDESKAKEIDWDNLINNEHIMEELVSSDKGNDVFTKMLYSDSNIILQIIRRIFST